MSAPVLLVCVHRDWRGFRWMPRAGMAFAGWLVFMWRIKGTVVVQEGCERGLEWADVYRYAAAPQQEAK